MRQRRNWPVTLVRWLVSEKQLTVRTVASIVTTVLFLSGCASSQKIVTAARQEQVSAAILTDSAVHLTLDSVSEMMEIRTELVKVPMSAVTLTIATDSLRSLPAGANYSERSGQSSVKVSRKAATASEPEYIYVYASCDSLQLQCERYERTIRTLHRDYGEHLNEMQVRLMAASHELEEEKGKPPNAIGTALKWYFYGLLSGILVNLIIGCVRTFKRA